MWDRFHYRLGGASWGDPASPVHLAPAWEGGLPPLDAYPPGQRDGIREMLDRMRLAPSPVAQAGGGRARA